MECYNNALQLDPSSYLAKSHKDRLIARGIPDRESTLDYTGSDLTIITKTLPAWTEGTLRLLYPGGVRRRSRG
jgi:hypothetical protein